MAGEIAALIEAVAAEVAPELFELQVVADVVVHVRETVRLVRVADQARQQLLRSAGLVIYRHEASVVAFHVCSIVPVFFRLKIALLVIDQSYLALLAFALRI